LAKRLEREGTLAPDEVTRLAEQLCEALAYAHERGVLHLDIKPSNILLGADGAKLADFGISVSVRETMLRPSRPGTVGTLPYMAPEQIHGQEAPTKRTDIYQLAVTLYECLAGQPPFHQGAIEWQILNQSPRPLSGVPEALASPIMRGLAKDAASRPADAVEFRASLAAKPARRPDRHRRRPRPLGR
jgi:serine/threonine-protein kinase